MATLATSMTSGMAATTPTPIVRKLEMNKFASSKTQSTCIDDDSWSQLSYEDDETCYTAMSEIDPEWCSVIGDFDDEEDTSDVLTTGAVEDEEAEQVNDDEPENMLPSARAPEEAAFKRQAQEESTPHRALIVFDWDDTLLPTSWIKYARKQGTELDDEQIDKELADHEEAVMELLRTAKALGDVSIVTLGSRKWVKNTCKSYLPDIATLDDSFDVHFARDVEVQPGISGDLAAAKKKLVSMQSAIESKGGNTRQWSSFISIGDSIAEMCAAQELGNQYAKEGTFDYVKTVKMIEMPNLRTLTKQVRTIADRLPDLVVQSNSSHVDIVDWLQQA